MSKISETEIKSMTKEQNYMRGYRDGKSDILDKIRTEIMSLDYIDEDKYEGTSVSPMIDRDDVLDVIDKYKVESGE